VGALIVAAQARLRAAWNNILFLIGFRAGKLRLRSATKLAIAMNTLLLMLDLLTSLFSRSAEPTRG
jgi:hypothetical protein